jgi:exonuclease VII large subunit
MKAAAAWAALSRGTIARLIAASKDIDQHAIELQQLVRVVERRLASLDERQRYLDAVRPERILARGDSLTRDASGNIIRELLKFNPARSFIPNFPKAQSPAR